MIGHNGAPTFCPTGGWVAIARSMRDHPIVGFHLFAKPCDPTRGALQPALAFIDLLMECRYESGFVMNGGRKMEVKRGQLIGAVSWLANRWNWTPMAVRIWLDKLEADAMISRHIPGASESNKHVGKVATVITLCNYDQYQASAADRQQTQQQTNSKPATNEQQQYKDNKGTREQGNNSKLGRAPLQPDGLASLNGSAEPMISDVIRWMHSGDEISARKWLASTVAIYGQDVVKDAWIKLGTDMASGTAIAQPLPTWSRIAQRMRDERKLKPNKSKLSRW